MADGDLEPLTDEAAAAMIAVLNEHQVQYVVVGGFGIQLHGVVGLARTSDIDVTPERGRSNLERLAAALNALDAQLRGAGLPDDGLPVDWHHDLLDRMDVALNLVTRYGPLDITLQPAGTDGYPDLARAAVEFRIAGTVLPTASLEDIIRSKQAAGRPKDNVALPTLLAHLRQTAEGDDS